VTVEPRALKVAGTLAVACALGFVLRWRGLDFQLPHSTPSDEQVIVNQVDRIRRGLPQPELDGTVAPAYPLLLARIAAPVRVSPRPASPRTLREHELAASALRMDVRVALMLVSLAGVLGTWWVARAFLEPFWAGVAAVLFASSLLAVSQSQMARPHAPLAALSVLAVAAALRFVREPGPGRLVLAGLAAAAAVACLHSGTAVLPSLLVAILIARRRAVRLSIVWVAAVLLLLAVIVRLFYPFHFEDWTAREGKSRPGLFNLSGHLVWVSDFDGSGFERVLGTFYSYDPTLLLLASVGLVAFAVDRLRRRPLAADRAQLTVALAYALPYLLVIGLYSRTPARFVLPLLPWAAVFGAWGARRAFTALLGAAPARALAAALLVLPVAMAWHLGTLRSVASTERLAADWIRANVDPATGRTFVLPYLALPLVFGPESLEHNWKEAPKTEWTEYLSQVPQERLPTPRWEVFLPKKHGTDRDLGQDPLRWIRAQGFDHVVVQHVRDSFQEKSVPATRRALQREGELEARFTPLRDDGGDPARLNYEYARRVLGRPLFLHLFYCDRMGPTIEVYRLN